MSTTRNGFAVLVLLLAQLGSFVSPASYLLDSIDQEQITTNSKFNWIGYGAAPVMPWTRGLNVCAVEEVVGGGSTRSRRRYHSECMAFLPRRICQKPTFIRYHCCTGYEKEYGEDSAGCRAVKPIDSLLETMQHLYLNDFHKSLKTSGLATILTEKGKTYTVFAPHNEAYSGLSKETKDQLSAKADRDYQDHPLALHIVRDRQDIKQLRNSFQVPTLYRKNETLHVHRYSNGIMTVNCVRIVLPNQLATNGIIHITEKVLRPVDARSTVFGILENDDRFEELVTALDVTGIALELKTHGRHYTVFAPTDAAFEAMDDTLKERILEDNELMKKLLYYHIVDCCICSAAILGPTSVRTLEGQSVNLSCDASDRVLVNDVRCQEVDIVAGNGVVHVIDEVLVPDSVRGLAFALRQLGLEAFVGFAELAGWQDILRGARHGTGREADEEEFTIFAPNDLAFHKLSDSELRVLRENKTEAKRILDYHMVSGRISTKRIVGTEVLRTAKTSSETFQNVYIDAYGINDARIISADHGCVRGVVHVIDRVLRPPHGTLLDLIRERSELSIFFGLIEAAGLSSALYSTDRDGTAVWTVFAPTNSALEKEKTAVDRLRSNSDKLKKFLDHHLVDERPVFCSSIRQKLQHRFRTSALEWIRVKQGSDSSHVVLNKKVRVTKADLLATNGVLHVIDQPLIEPSRS